MKQIIRSATRQGYKRVAKPILFKNKPDAVHKGTVKLAKKAQKIFGLKQLPKLWAYQNPILNTEVAGVKFSNPIGLSAGFDKAIEMPPLMKNVGFGWMTGGSVTLGSYKGNDGDWYYRLPKTKSIVVNAGLPSEGTEAISRRVADYRVSLFNNFPLNVSVAKTNSRQSATDKAAIDDYCQSLKVFNELAQVKMLEINISCPNTFGGEPFTTADRLEKLLTRVDKLKLSKPVFIKMPISLPLGEFDALLEVLVRHNITGVAIGNLNKNIKEVELRDILPDTVKGNLSGFPTQKISNELIRYTFRKYGDKLKIIGIGGVFSAQDAYDKITSGASLVGLISGLMFEGPQLVGEINHGLVKLLKKDRFSSLSEAVGSSIKP